MNEDHMPWKVEWIKQRLSEGSTKIISSDESLHYFLKESDEQKLYKNVVVEGAYQLSEIKKAMSYVAPNGTAFFNFFRGGTILGSGRMFDLYEVLDLFDAINVDYEVRRMSTPNKDGQVNLLGVIAKWKKKN